MPHKPVSTLLSTLLLVGILSACGGNAATATPVPGIETLVAGTYLTMTAEVQSLPASGATVTPTLIPTIAPVDVIPAGFYGPWPAEYCDLLRADLEQALAVPAATEIVGFDDMYGGTGNACRIHITGNGVSLGMAGPLAAIVTVLLDSGWIEDNTRSAAGPQTILDGFLKGAVLGILTVHWDPSADVNCPQDQPISACVFAPEQKLFDVTFDAARIVTYMALPLDQCAGWTAIIQPVLPVTLVTEIIAFHDVTGEIGTACRLRAAGTGLDFDSFVTPSTALGDVLVSNGWVRTNGADGPTGALNEYVRDNLVVIVTVGWDPSADATCPSDQPISACPLAPQQKLYTITVDFAQK